MSQVFVVDQERRPLAPVHPGYARWLLSHGKAAVLHRAPFTLLLKRACPEAQPEPLRLKLDPGSKTTGLAVVDDETGQVVWAAELAHRGEEVKHALEQRRGVRRSRRQRHTRYRQPRCAPRHAAMYLPRRGKEREGRFLGHPSYLEPKGKGDRSMMEKQVTSRGV